MNGQECPIVASPASAQEPIAPEERATGTIENRVGEQPQTDPESQSTSEQPMGTPEQPGEPDTPCFKAKLRPVLRILGIAIAALFACGAIAASVLYYGMRPLMLHEYGEPLPDASAFYPEHDCAYANLPENAEQKGMHRLTVQTEHGPRWVWLYVRDTIAPTAEGAERTISTRETLKPDELIQNLKDNDLVKVSFSETPAFGIVGDYTPVILLEDVSGNRSSVTASLSIRVTNDGITCEAGSEAPKPDRFLYDQYSVDGMTEITDAMLHTPGEYPITITVDGVDYSSNLTVVDTIAPEGEAQMLVCVPDRQPTPEDFLVRVVDETAVTATFVTAPDPDSREVQPVSIRLTDLGGNTSEVAASLLFTHAKPLTVEARFEPLTAKECLPDLAEETEAELVEPFLPDTVGTYAITVRVDGSEELALVEVKDTTPPAITAEAYTWYTNHPLDPSMLCGSVSDVTETVVTTAEPIDWQREGVQTVTLRATDRGGNTSEALLTLTLVHDTEAPVLYGVVNRNCYVGEAVAYFAEVFATDNLDETVNVEVDNSAVDPNRAGTYEVTYSVTDSDGNTASETCRFKFVAATVTDEEVQALADEVLAGILTDGMTKTEQLEAVYNYVRGHVHYINASDKNDWRKEAVRGIRTGKGDCFTFYSVTRALLDRIDVDYMSLTRKGGRTRHFWVIVNVGTGWYHFDPTYASHHKHRCFMWTNKQCKVKPYFWRYEESDYPPIATEPFDKNAVIAAERARMQTGT